MNFAISRRPWPNVVLGFLIYSTFLFVCGPLLVMVFLGGPVFMAQFWSGSFEEVFQRQGMVVAAAYFGTVFFLGGQFLIAAFLSSLGFLLISRLESRPLQHMLGVFGGAFAGNLFYVCALASLETSDVKLFWPAVLSGTVIGAIAPVIWRAGFLYASREYNEPDV